MKILGLAAGWFGSLNPVVHTLILLTAMDFVSGIIKAVAKGELSSAAASKGITKKAMQFILLAAIWVLENQFGFGKAIAIDLCAAAAGFYCVAEVISILENAKALGVPVPDFMWQRLQQFQEQSKTTTTTVTAVIKTKEEPVNANSH